jgi:hypothetical protein
MQPPLPASKCLQKTCSMHDTGVQEQQTRLNYSSKSAHMVKHKRLLESVMHMHDGDKELKHHWAHMSQVPNEHLVNESDNLG